MTEQEARQIVERIQNDRLRAVLDERQERTAEDLRSYLAWMRGLMLELQTTNHAPKPVLKPAPKTLEEIYRMVGRMVKRKTA